MPDDLDAGIREAFRLFRADIVAYEAEVLRSVKVPLEPHEFYALVSFHYNTGGIATAALTRHLNMGNRVAAAAAFMGWLKPAAIRSRREAERDLFARGIYPTGTIPVWSVDRNGRVDFSRPIRRLSETEALALLRPSLNPQSIPMSPAPSTAATDTAPVQEAPRLTTRIFAFLKTLIGA